MKSWLSFVYAWTVMGVAALVLAVGCGTDEEKERDRASINPTGGSANVAGSGSESGSSGSLFDVSGPCDLVGALAECTVNIDANGVHLCYDGNQVCQGEDGWSDCMATEDAEALVRRLTEGAGGAGN